MEKSFKDIDFDNMNLCEYQEEINKINKEFNELLKNKSIKKALRKYKIRKIIEKIFINKRS